MIASMTGYGKAEAPLGDLMVAIEVRSVNHRFCEVTARLPKALAGAETRFRKVVQGRVARGRVDVTVTIGPERSPRQLVFDTELARQYYSALVDLKRDLDLSGDIDLRLVASARDLVTFVEPQTDTAALADHVEALIGRAMDGLEVMRRQEGAAMVRDLTLRVDAMREQLDVIARRAPTIVREYAGRLQSRIKLLTQGVDLDPGRLAQEVALHAERSDYTEEVTRLRAHLAQCDQMLKSGGAVGRQLDFLFQEMNREINTIGSKAGDSEVALGVVAIKSELEKMREQVQNIE